MEYMTIAEAAEKWGISTRRVQILCATERIPGLMKFGNKIWAIPKTAEKPADARLKSGKYVGAKKRTPQTPHDTENEQ